MTDLKDSQFTLLPDGQVAFQPDPTNPLPGTPHARLEKGESALRPRLCVLPDRAMPEGFEERAAQWLETRIATVLEPLALLGKAANLSPALQGVAAALLSGFGAVARAELLADLPGLTPDDRQILRARKIRSGSLHVYFQDLNKPAAVRLRALLWALWHDAPVPPPLPHDGAVSALCPPDVPEAFTKAYWLSIGYPLCARRLVRIDMLDRLVGAVYDGAHKGTFRATHQMAEWLGVPIETLYEILDSLGHRRIEELETPVSAPEAAPESAAPSLPTQAQDQPSEDKIEGTLPSQDGAPPQESAADPTPAVELPKSPALPAAATPVTKKPELALFRLARMHGPAHRPATRARGPGPVHQTGEIGPQQSAEPAGPSDRAHGPRKGRRAREEGGETRAPRSKAGQPDKSRDRGEGKHRPPRPRHGAEDPRARAERPERVIRAEAKVNPEDSPFAVLRRLMKPQSPEEGAASDKAADGG